MGKKTVFKIFIVLLSVMLFSVGCSSSSESNSMVKENKEKSVTLLYGLVPASLDPHLEWIPIRAGITETLVKMDRNLEIKPWLAESWEQIDEKTWTFKLRDGVTFHDGSKMDAEAVKSSFERAIKVNAALKTLLKVESIEANGQKITFKTVEANPAFLSELVHPNASIVQVNAEHIEKAPIGTGPFKVASYTQDVEVKVDRFNKYWDGAAKLDHAIVKFNSDGNVRSLALQSGDADISYHLPIESLGAISKNKNLKVESISSLRVHFILFNSKKPELQDIRVRKAIDAIINRPVIASDLMKGHATPANGPFNPRFSFASDIPYTGYNPKQAISLLEEAGYQLNQSGKMEKGGKPLSLKLVTFVVRPELPLIAQYVQAEAAKIGVDIKIITAENVDSYLQDHIDEWDMVTYSNLTAPRGDGGYFFNVAYLPEGTLNLGQINIPELSSIVKELNQTSDSAKRDELEKQAVKITREQVLHSYIVFPHIIVGINKRVTNWKPGAEEQYFITNTMDVK